MDKGFSVVLGMSVAYIASFAGMAFAYWAYRRRKKQDGEKDNE